jgi:hypothetical protein
MTLNWSRTGTYALPPQLSYPYLAHGIRGILISHLETDVTYNVPHTDGYPHGWMDPTQARYRGDGFL